jgi:membrane-associated protein
MSLHEFWNVFTHIDVHAAGMAARLGDWSYVLLAMFVFLETGAVVMPYLPGDTLLFALGALCANDSMPLDVRVLGAVLYVAAVLGDMSNYLIGRRLGPTLIVRIRRRWFRQAIVRARRFYVEHGGKTVLVARFLPFMRTTAPFLAGVGRMRLPRFFLFNIVGTGVWTFVFLAGGYWFGRLPAVRQRFHWVIVAIVAMSVVPATIKVIHHQWKARRAAAL